MSNILQSYPATLKYRFLKKIRFCILICIPLNWRIPYWFDQQNVRPKYKFSSTHPVDIESYMQNIRRLNVRKWFCFFIHDKIHKIKNLEISEMYDNTVLPLQICVSVRFLIWQSCSYFKDIEWNFFHQDLSYACLRSVYFCLIHNIRVQPT